jgi:hypothetical protein
LGRVQFGVSRSGTPVVAPFGQSRSSAALVVVGDFDVEGNRNLGSFLQSVSDAKK